MGRYWAKGRVRLRVRARVRFRFKVVLRNVVAVKREKGRKYNLTEVKPKSHDLNCGLVKGVGTIQL